MTDAPERIWAYSGAFKKWRDHKTDQKHVQTEYIRADLAKQKEMLPKTWPEIAGWKNRVQRQLLSKAARSAKGDINAAAQSIDMERFHFVATCQRKGVDPKTGEFLG